VANYIRAFTVMMIGIALGLLLTAASLRSGHGVLAIHAGPWTAWPHNGALDVDPYARAILAQTGEAPLGREEGLVFLAEADSSGARLDGRCEYRVVDPMPPARYWTLGLASRKGFLLDNPTGRYAYSSSDILRRDAGAFEITVANDARPGNWLSAGNAQAFMFVLRLYDTSLDVDAPLDPATFPTITKIRCA
jgi:hypothetical protein